MTAAPPRLTYIPDLLEQHVEEIEFLWAQREVALGSPRYTMRELAQLDERIEAHVQGVIAAAEHAIPLLEERLAATEAPAVFAGAYPMLRLGGQYVSRVLEIFSASRGPRLDGITRALSMAPVEAFLPQIRSLVLSAEPAVAAAATEVLIFRRAHDPKPGRILLLVQEEEPSVRLRAWRVAGYLGTPLEPRLYASGMRDENAAVRSAALLAAAWSRVSGAVMFARQLARVPTPENLDQIRLLAILGAPQDLPLMVHIGREADLGPARFRLIGSYGHPLLVDLLLSELGNPDPTSASAAAAAFTKITGEVVDSGDRVKTSAPGSLEVDEFEAEFQEEVILPNQELARRRWAELKPRLSQASRLTRGFDVSHVVAPEVLAQLEMESRWEACLRGRFEGSWTGSPADLEAFPQPA
jgi:uncharacterized protein (TIGR02270 family)